VKLALRLSKNENNMKRIISSIYVILMVATALLLVSCQRNEISIFDAAAGLNGSFETAESNYPVNWTFFPNPESSATLQVTLDPENVVEGNHSLKLVAKQNDKVPGFRSRRIPVQSGNRYKLTISTKSDGCTFKVNRIVQDTLGKKNLRSDIIINTLKPSFEWQKHEETLFIAEGEAYVLLIFLIDGTGAFWCDDIQFEKIS
jgi:hypothetical protein